MSAMRVVLLVFLLTLYGWMALDPLGGSQGFAEDSWQKIEIRADEYSFTPNHIRATAGRPLEFIVVNSGHEPHQFRSSLFKDQTITVEVGENTVHGKGIDIVEIAPGATARIKLLSPPAGEYDFQCRIPSHHGMDGVIQIRAEGGSASP